MSSLENRRWEQVIAVVIPSYRVIRHIQQVIAGIGPEVALIYPD